MVIKQREDKHKTVTSREILYTETEIKSRHKKKCGNTTSDIKLRTNNSAP
jgi:hypothetical protein